MRKKAFIFGSGSAIAAEVAVELLRTGYDLCLVYRDSAKHDLLLQRLQKGAPEIRVHSVYADLADASLHEEVWRQLEHAAGAPDIVLVCFGSLTDQVRAEKELDYLRSELVLNGVNVTNLLTLAAGKIQPGRSSAIAALNSVAGDRGRRSNFAYGAAKGMVSTFMSGLMCRMADAQVRVIDFRLGRVRTPMTQGLTQTGPMWSEPAGIAADIVKALESRSGVVYIPGYWRWVMMIICALPRRVFVRVKL